MKKNIFFYLIPLFITMICIFYIKVNHTNINILIFLVFTALFPIISIFICTFIIGYKNYTNKILLFNILFAIIIFLIIGVFNFIFIDETMLNQMTNNTKNVANVDIQTTEGNNVSGNITSIFLFSIVSIVGTFLGKKFKGIKNKKTSMA